MLLSAIAGLPDVVGSLPSADANVAAVATSFLLLPQFFFKVVALAGVLKINLL